MKTYRTKEIIENLLKSDEPAIRLKTRLLLLSEDVQSNHILQLQQEVRSSHRTKLLLSERDLDGRIPRHPYAKWDGAHWVLAALADLGYPPGDESLVPLREQVYEWLLSKEHQDHTEARPYRHHPDKSLIKVIKDRPRIHASMEGNAVWSLIVLGLFDERTEELVNRLQRTQWPDGGWNCDGDPRALISSFMESLLPFRALALHAKMIGKRSSAIGAQRAAEVFLKRRLYKKVRNGAVMNPQFTRLHYPCYWHYDILFGLKVMAETGRIKDGRCNEALDLLESKRLVDGCFPVESKYYRVAKGGGGRSLVNWGPTGIRHMNEFATVDALWILKEAGRLEP